LHFHLRRRGREVSIVGGRLILRLGRGSLCHDRRGKSAPAEDAQPHSQQISPVPEIQSVALIRSSSERECGQTSPTPTAQIPSHGAGAALIGIAVARQHSFVRREKSLMH
jgi:hypothetical protein